MTRSTVHKMSTLELTENGPSPSLAQNQDNTPTSDGAAQTERPVPHGRDIFDYQIDFWQRTILYWDTLRQRADNMLEHERAGLPPLLDFKYETILDARTFEPPVNYALLRITEIGNDCWDGYRP